MTKKLNYKRYALFGQQKMNKQKCINQPVSCFTGTHKRDKTGKEHQVAVLSKFLRHPKKNLVYSKK